METARKLELASVRSLVFWMTQRISPLLESSPCARSSNWFAFATVTWLASPEVRTDEPSTRRMSSSRLFTRILPSQFMTITKFAHLLLESTKILRITSSSRRAQVTYCICHLHGEVPAPKRAKSGAADPAQTGSRTSSCPVPRTPSGAGHDKRRETTSRRPTSCRHLTCSRSSFLSPSLLQNLCDISRRSSPTA